MFFVSHVRPMGLNALEATCPAYCDVAMLPVITKDLNIYPRLSPTTYFYRDASSALLYTHFPSATTRPRVAVPGETNLSTQVTTDTAVA